MYLSHDFVLACISFTNFIPVSIIYCILFLQNRTEVLTMFYLFGFLLLCEVVGRMVLLDSGF